MPLASLAPVEIPDRALQSALEFAVGVAAASTKLRPPLDHPSGLKPYLRFQTLPPKALGPVRAAVEADAVFRSRLGQVATRELLDEVGMLWLTRPEGWQAAVADLLAADAADAAADDAVSARREQKRRHAAERGRDEEERPDRPAHSAMQRTSYQSSVGSRPSACTMNTSSSFFVTTSAPESSASR